MNKNFVGITLASSLAMASTAQAQTFQDQSNLKTSYAQKAYQNLVPHCPTHIPASHNERVSCISATATVVQAMGTSLIDHIKKAPADPNSESSLQNLQKSCEDDLNPILDEHAHFSNVREYYAAASAQDKECLAAIEKIGPLYGIQTQLEAVQFLREFIAGTAIDEATPSDGTRALPSDAMSAATDQERTLRGIWGAGASQQCLMKRGNPGNSPTAVRIDTLLAKMAELSPYADEALKEIDRHVSYEGKHYIYCVDPNSSNPAVYVDSGIISLPGQSILGNSDITEGSAFYSSSLNVAYALKEAFDAVHGAYKSFALDPKNYVTIFAPIADISHYAGLLTYSEQVSGKLVMKIFLKSYITNGRPIVYWAIHI